MFRLLATRSLLVAVLSVGLAAAGPGHARTFVDAGGRSVEIPDRIERVLAAGPPAQVFVYVVAPDKLIGWIQQLTEDQKRFIPEPWRSLPQTPRLTGRDGPPSAETLRAFAPDVILDVGTVDARYIETADRVQAETGIPYILVGGAFADTPETLRTLGDLLGETERAEAQAAFADETLARIERSLAAVPEADRPSAYLGRGRDGLETGGAGSINVELLSAVGTRNVAAGEGDGGLATVTADQIRAWNPAVILTQEPAFAAAIQASPDWSQVAAVAGDRVWVAPALPFGWLDGPPAANRLIGAEWLAGRLYPNVPQTDLRERTRAFYDLFYHRELTDAELDILLGP